MSVADELLKANEDFARNFKLGELSVRPKRHVAVLACMDARLVLSQILGTAMGDIHMIRNAGGTVTEDAFRFLIISQLSAGHAGVHDYHHTDCEMLTF